MGCEGLVWQTLNQYHECSDLELAQHAAAGETLARRVLVDRYLPLIYSVCIRSGLSRHDAQDMSQECVIKLLRVLPQYRGDAKLSTWIYTICKRCIADHFRAGARREETVDWTDPVQQARADMQQQGRHHDPHQEREDADRMTRWISELGEPLRTVMLRFYLADDSISDIARDLKLAEGTIKTHLFRGRQLLRQRLEARPV